MTTVLRIPVLRVNILERRATDRQGDLDGQVAAYQPAYEGGAAANLV